MRAAERDADARVDPHRAHGEAERLGERLPDAVADRDGLLGRLEVAADHDELVAADAGERVDAADRGTHARRDAAQQLVAERVTEPVVHLLEPVEVDVQRRGQRALFEDRREHLEQLRAVRDAGERVAPRLFGEPLFELAPFGDVGDEHDRAEVRPVVLAHRARPEPRPHEAAVEGDEPEVVLVARVVASTHAIRERAPSTRSSSSMKSKSEPPSISFTVVPSRSASAWFANVVLPSASTTQMPSRASSTMSRYRSSLSRSAPSVRMLAETSRMLRTMPAISGSVEVVGADDLGLEPGAVGVPQPHEQGGRAGVGRAQRRRESLERADLVDGVDEVERAGAEQRAGGGSRASPPPRGSRTSGVPAASITAMRSGETRTDRVDRARRTGDGQVGIGD